MRRISVHVSAALVAVLAAAMVASSVALAADPAANSADLALDDALKKLIAMPGGPPGVIAIVQRGDDLAVHQFGLADLSDDQPMRIDDYMRIASVAKAFSGATALSLVSEGVLSLDDTVGARLPGLPAGWSAVTLRQLLGHTSGLPDFSQNAALGAAVQASPMKAPLPREMLAYIKDEPLIFPPGSRYNYSNTDNIVVGLMVEAATNSTYTSQLETQVCKPLGLTRTSLPAGPEIPEPFIHGYDNDPTQQPREDVSKVIAAGWPWASGGVVSSPGDLNSFIRGYVGGKLFDTKTQAQQRIAVEGAESDPTGPGKNAAGLAVFRYETSCGTVWGHTGNIFGYTQFAAASPDGTGSVTVSVNEQLNANEGAPGVMEALREVEELAVCAALSSP